MLQKLIEACLALVLVISFFAYSVNWLFFGIQRIEGQDKITEVSSADNKYTVTAYLNSGGATTGWSVLGTLTDNEIGKNKNIYWQYDCSEADIYWIDETTVSINDVELNVLKDTYDYRKQ